MEHYNPSGKAITLQQYRALVAHIKRNKRPSEVRPMLEALAAKYPAFALFS